MQIKIRNNREPQVEKKYKDILQPKTLSKCKEYSAFFYDHRGGVFDASEIIKSNKAQIKNFAKTTAHSVISLEKDNQRHLLEYFEKLVLNEGNTEFILPYRFITEALCVNPISQITALEESHHFGALGTVGDILSSEVGEV